MITRLINIFHWLRPSQLEGIHVHPEIKNVNLFPCMVMFKGVCLKNRNVVFTKLGETLSYTKLYSKHLEKKCLHPTSPLQKAGELTLPSLSNDQPAGSGC